MRADYGARVRRAQAEMARQGVDAALVGIGSDLLYFTGYHAHHSSRPTLLVVPREGDAKVVVPAFEAPRIKAAGVPFELITWTETQSPVPITADLLRAAGGERAMVSAADEVWARWLIRIQHALPSASWRVGSELIRELRMVKDEYEIHCLREAARLTDLAWAQFLAEHPLEGKTEQAAIAPLIELFAANGLEIKSAGICGSGPNGASPHHKNGERRIERGDAVVFDFGARYEHYTSDITRTVHVGEPTDEFRRCYDLVVAANQAAFEAVRPGLPCQEVDRAARKVIADGGYGDAFIHRLGHGIGLDGHEEPYMVEGNTIPLKAGMTFSDEPGIYLAGKFGIRVEDTLVCTERGAERLNTTPHALPIVR